MQEKPEYSLRFLVLRAVAVLLVVIAVLVGLRLAGLTGVDRDLSPEAVEEMAQNFRHMEERP